MGILGSMWKGSRSQRYKWTISIITLSLLFGMLGILPNIPSVRAQLFQDVWVDDDYENPPDPYYTTISLGIANVEVGGTVHVNPGNYSETLSINKNLTIVENRSGEIVLSLTVPGGLSTYVTIGNSSEVEISGLTIREVREGKLLNGVVVKENSHANISNCSFINLNVGISIEDGSSAYVGHNFFNQSVILSNSSWSAKFVKLEYQSEGEYTTISNNTAIFKFWAWGIHADRTAIKLIENNVLYQNSSEIDCTNNNHLERDGAIVLYQQRVPGSTVIRNNTMSGFCWGVSTEGVNATLENNTVSQSYIGISSSAFWKTPDNQKPSNLTVYGNNITFKERGLSVSTFGSYMKAVNNTVTGLDPASGTGAYVKSKGSLDLGPNNTISNAFLGVKTYADSFSNATQNTIFSTSEGFHSEGKDKITYNEFHSNEEGIRVQGNPIFGQREISNNTIEGSYVRAGIWVWNSVTADKIQNNEIRQGYRGIWITGNSASKTIRWNNITDNDYGVHFEPEGATAPSFVTVEDNNISFNEYGIYVDSSNGNTLQNNNISCNRNSGIHLDTVSSVTVRYSNISNNFMGIVLTEKQPLTPPSLTIFSNSIIGNALWAINSSVSYPVGVEYNFFGAWFNETIEEMLSGDLSYYPWLGYRESGVSIIEDDAVVFPESTYFINQGIIVNSSGSLTFFSNVDAVFNNPNGQNFIQVNGMMTVEQDCTFSSNFGNFTVIYTDGSLGTIVQSAFEGQMSLSIQSSGLSVSDTSFTNGINGIIINQGDNSSISGSEMSGNRENGTYLFSSQWNEYTDSEVSSNGDYGVRMDMSENNSFIGGGVTENGISCVSLWHSDNNNVSKLNITSCIQGIYTESSSTNSFTSNNVSSNDYGIQLTSSSINNTIWQSNISNNFVGIAVNSSHPNYINNNSILGNVFYAISAPSIFQDYLDAEGNYFGTNVSGQIEKLVTSNVDITPCMDFRESNVEYISNNTQWTSDRTIQKGVIVNATGRLDILGTVGSSINITFNGTHGQNFIQVNNENYIHDAVLKTESGPYTLLYLNSTDGKVLRSNISGFMGLGIQSEEARTTVSGISISESNFYQGRYGLVLHGAANTLIEKSNIDSTTHWGAYMHTSSQIDVGTGNNISHTRHGFLMEETVQVNVTGNVFHNNTVAGMTLGVFWPNTILPWNRSYSVFIDVVGNMFVDNYVGVSLGNYSRQNNVTKNNLTANQDGVYIIGSIFDGNHTIASNEFHGSQRGVYIEKSIFNNVSGNSFSDNGMGVSLKDVEPLPQPNPPTTNTIQNNSVQNGNSGDKGVYLISSKLNLVYSNWVNSSFSGEKGTDTWGIDLEGSSSNILSKNLIQTNEHGIRLDNSPDNNLTFNNMTNNFYNFGVTGTEASHFPQEINTSNVVNGSQIHYLVEVDGAAVASDAGYVGIVSSSNITVANVTVHNNFQGVLVADSVDSEIRKPKVNWTHHGIDILFSSNITVKGHDTSKGVFEDNVVGVSLYRTDESTVENSTVTRSENQGVYIAGTSTDTAMWNNVSRVDVDECGTNGQGIRLDYARFSTVGNGTVDSCEFGVYVLGGDYLIDTSSTVIFMNLTNNGYGLRITSWATNVLVANNSVVSNDVGISIAGNAKLNVIYHNNFTGNTLHHGIDKSHVHVYTNNTWDNGYNMSQGGGGNWWDNHSPGCVDNCSGYNDGSNQTGPGSDGICDVAKYIYGPNTDYYPLKNSPIVGPRP